MFSGDITVQLNPGWVRAIQVTRKGKSIPRERYSTLRNSTNRGVEVGKKLAHVRCWKQARVFEASQGTRGGLPWAGFCSIS